MKAITSLLAVLAVVVGIRGAWAQPEIEWERTYGGAAYDRCASLIQTQDGGYAIAGSTNIAGVGNEDFLLLRLNSDGDSLWSRTYRGAESDECQAIVQKEDGGFILAGSTLSFGAGGWDFWVVETNADGDSLWSQTYGGEGYDGCRAITINDWCVTLAGSTLTLEGVSGILLVQLNHAGNTIGSRVLEGWGSDISSIIQTAGGFALAGATGDPESDGTFFWLCRTNWSFDVQWMRTYHQGKFGSCTGLVQTNDGGFAMVGYNLLLKTNVAGDSLWSQRYAERYEDGTYWYTDFISIIPLIDGGFALPGISRDIAGNWNYWVTRTDCHGTVLWSTSFRNDVFNECTTAIQLPDGSFVLGGNTGTEMFRPQDVYLVKTTPDPVSVRDLFSSRVPCAFLLSSAYPNPFNATTRITYSLPRSEYVTLRLYNLSGREVARFVDGDTPAGIYSVEINAINLPSGLHFSKLVSSGEASTVKLMLVK